MPKDVHVSLVVAMAENRVIGNNGKIPWHISGEQKIFRRLTEGHIILMGRKTFESIGRALANRQTLVLTRQNDYYAPDCTVIKTLDDAIEFTRQQGEELFVAGGAEIYALTIKHAYRIYLTEIHRSFEGEARFPEFEHLFSLIDSEEVHGEIPYTFKTYERNKQA